MHLLRYFFQTSYSCGARYQSIPSILIDAKLSKYKLTQTVSLLSVCGFLFVNNDFKLYSVLHTENDPRLYAE